MDPKEITCPLCGAAADEDDLRPATIADLEFRSFSCSQPPEGLSDHMFPVRWLESRIADEDELTAFEQRFVYVRGPLPDGSPIADAFGDRDPILAWIETEPVGDKLRLMIRL